MADRRAKFEWYADWVAAVPPLHARLAAVREDPSDAFLVPARNWVIPVVRSMVVLPLWSVTTSRSRLLFEQHEGTYRKARYTQVSQ